MNLIERNSINELSIGNIDIDNDHMRLLELLQDLFNLTEFNSNREDFAKILSGLTDYALLHFKKEEMYMQEFSYPKLTEHKRSHQKYIYKVAMYNHNLSRINPPSPNEIIDFLEEWWINHILDKDLDYENYKKEIGSNAIYRIFL